MATIITVDPMTRIEGHLRFETKVERGRISDAHVSGEMFRGLERALQGYDARVAQQVTQRVCGVCPYAHGEASAMALEDAMGIAPPDNGKRLRNLIVGAYQLHDYLLHFYVLSALDFFDITAVRQYAGRSPELTRLRDWVESELSSGKIFPGAPLLPRWTADYATDTEMNLTAIAHYVQSVPILADLQKMVAIFGARAPHPTAIEAGGVTTLPTAEALAKYSTLLERVEAFVRGAWFQDITAVASAFPSYFREGRGCGDFLSFPYLVSTATGRPEFAGGTLIDGKFSPLDISRITEDHTHAWYTNMPDRDVRPMAGTDLEPIDRVGFERSRTQPEGKYSWTRAPRYGGKVVEVGPMARLLITMASGENPALTRRVEEVNGMLGITLEDYPSVLGRHLSRYLAAEFILESLRAELDAVEPGRTAFREAEIPKNAEGMGLTEASRGALAHFVRTDDKGLIAKYEMIVPTTWNMSPRDADGRPGPVEQMLIGTEVADPDNPIELARIVRSADPCMACSVH